MTQSKQGPCFVKKKKKKTHVECLKGHWCQIRDITQEEVW